MRPPRPPEARTTLTFMSVSVALMQVQHHRRRAGRRSGGQGPGLDRGRCCPTTTWSSYPSCGRSGHSRSISSLEHAESIDGPLCAALAGVAARTGTWLYGGSFPERATGADGALPAFQHPSRVRPERAAGGQVPQGPSLRLQRRRDDGHEQRGPRPRRSSPARWGRPAWPPATTCASPSCSGGLVDAGAQTFVIPSGWPERRIMHWQAREWA